MKAPRKDQEALKLQPEALESKHEAYYCANQALPGWARGLALANKPIFDCIKHPTPSQLNPCQGTCCRIRDSRFPSTRFPLLSRRLHHQKSQPHDTRFPPQSSHPSHRRTTRKSTSPTPDPGRDFTMDELLARRDEASMNRLRLAEEFLDPRALPPPPPRQECRQNMSLIHL